MPISTQVATAHQTCVLTAFSLLPMKRLMRRCCLIHLKNSSGPETLDRYNNYQAVKIMDSAVPGNSSGQSLAISSGAGAGARHAVGTDVVGGMLAATFLAVFFIPLFYHWVVDRRLQARQEDIDAVSRHGQRANAHLPSHHPASPSSQD